MPLSQYEMKDVDQLKFTSNPTHNRHMWFIC